MGNSSTIKVTLAAGLALVLLLVIFLIAQDNGLGTDSKPKSNGSLPEDTTPFAPYQKSNETQPQDQGSSFYPNFPSLSLRNPLESSRPKPANSPTIQDEKLPEDRGNEEGEAPSAPTPPAAEPNFVLPLPAVAQTEISIDPNGATNFLTYAEQFVTLAANPTFPVVEYNAILKDENGIPLSPERLVEKAIQDKNFAQIQSSITITEKLVQYKIEKFGEIKVRDQGAVISAMIIGFEKLTLEMLGEAKKVAEGGLDQASFEKYFQKYNQSTSYYYDQLTSFYGGVANRKTETLWGKFADVLGFKKVAHAVGMLPFGGRISINIPCICSLGMTIYVGPPVPGHFFVSPLGSRIFANFRPVPSAWILGNYSPTPVPCLQFVLVGCAPQPGGENQGIVIIAGTS